MESSCKYIEYAVADSRHWVVLQLGELGGGGCQLPHKTQCLLQNTTHSIGPGRILWHNLNVRKWTLRCGTWNVKSLYRSGSFKMVARELGKYKLDLVGVLVRWDKGGAGRAED
jgi:hypothetical protein